MNYPLTPYQFIRTPSITNCQIPNMKSSLKSNIGGHKLILYSDNYGDTIPLSFFGSTIVEITKKE